MNERKNIIAMFTAPQKIELVASPLPVLESDYVCVEYLYCGICAGDYSVYRGYRHTFPISLGHEFVGRVLFCGNTVQGILPGQYVVSDFNYRCTKCVYCCSHQSHLCEQNNKTLFSNRGFAKYANIHFSYLVAIDPPVHLPRACLIEPLSCVIHACSYVGIKKGMKILICGGGGIGMLFCFYLRRVGKDIDITVAEVNTHKREMLVERFHVYEFNDKSNTIYDLVIDCSDSTTGLAFSLSKARRGGQMCIMSHLYGLDTSFVYEEICKNELKCAFPIRNGEKRNLELSAGYINCYWTSEDDNMLIIYDDIHAAFNEKGTSTYCEQIVRSTCLGIPKTN